MLASLPMYDLPELREATDAWWSGLRRALTAAGIANAPGRLLRGGAFGAEWLSSGLLLSQCCGWDLIHALAGRVQPLATPVYAAEGCSGPYYRSVIVVRCDDQATCLAELDGRVCAVNMTASQSGYNTLRYSLARVAGHRAVFRHVVVSGSHAKSLEWVRDGRADVAAIDCVAFALLRRHRPGATAGLRVLARSRRAPALPYIVRAGIEPDRLRRLQAGLRAALTDPTLQAARAALLIEDFVCLPASAYRYIATQHQRARRLGYCEVR